MIKDNVLVHKINGLETAGSLSILFSDKTGTITEGKLTVTEMATGDVKQFKKLSEVGDVLKKILSPASVSITAPRFLIMPSLAETARTVR